MERPQNQSNHTPPPNIPMGRGPGGGRGHGAPVSKPKNSKKILIELWKYLSANKIALTIAFVLVLLNSILTLIAAYMVRPILNGIVEHKGVNQLVMDLVYMFVIYFTAVLCQYLQTRIMLIIAQKSLQSIRNDLFKALQKLPLNYFDTNNNGDLMSRFTNDVDAINQMLSTTCVQLISGIVSIVTTLVIMLYTNWGLTLVTLALVPVFTLATRLISKYSRKYYKEQQKTLGDLNSYIEESITGQKVVKVFNHEEEAIKDFKKLNESYKNKSFKAQFIGGIMGPVMMGLGQFSYTATACVGGFFCVLNGFDVGGYTIFVNFSRSFTRPINDITMQVNTIFSALAGAERVFEVINQKPEIPDIENAVTKDIIGEVALENVDFSYIKGIPVLKNINLTAKVGQKIAFVGSTGAGKTTITNLLNRFYDIENGKILIDGEDIRNYSKEHLRKNIAIVLQDTHLFTGTIMENIRYGRLDATDKEVIEASVTANADQFIRRLENGYNTIITGDGSNLSQGQRQLLNIARTAISKAPILVLDEATSSVDTRTEKHIEEALDRLMKTRTTFVIAHRLSTVRNSDIIMVLENGEIIERGDHQSLLEKKGRYYNLYTGATKLS